MERSRSKGKGYLSEPVREGISANVDGALIKSGNLKHEMDQKVCECILHGRSKKAAKLIVSDRISICRALE